MFFEKIKQSSECGARTGRITTGHGVIETPIFMPVGTQATVKSLDARDIKEIDASIILANTYHLHLRPGEEVIDNNGGLHKFMNWEKPILTDSGGFQVFSLAQKKKGVETQDVASETQNSRLVKVDDEGVTFTSHLDGSRHRFTPEEAIRIEHKLGADIIMAFDECTRDSAGEEEIERAMQRTHAWAERCIVEHKKETGRHGYPQYLFGIIQGGGKRAYREISAKAITAMDFDGIAIGGESIGYNMEATKEILEWLSPLLPENKPRYTMGVGHSPRDLFEVVERGVDMFDCVSPTRMARNGALFVHPKVDPSCRIDITKSIYKEDKTPIDPLYQHPLLSGYTRGYIHHLFRAEELLAYRLATMHNLFFLLSLMRDMRVAIAEDRFLEMKQEWC